MESTSDVRQQAPRELPAMFRPPVNRAMRTLDRSFFCKTVPVSAAKIFQNSEISRVRKALSVNKDLLVLPRLNVVRELKEQDGVKKALLLREDVKHDGESFGIVVFGVGL
jgi:tRNA (guanine37-N1)-methyltransferase